MVNFSVIVVWFVVCFVKQFENFLSNRIDYEISWKRSINRKQKVPFLIIIVAVSQKQGK